jgi:hypothetical protein
MVLMGRALRNSANTDSALKWVASLERRYGGTRMASSGDWLSHSPRLFSNTAIT